MQAKRTVGQPPKGRNYTLGRVTAENKAWVGRLALEWGRTEADAINQLLNYLRGFSHIGDLRLPPIDPATRTFPRTSET